VSIFVEWSGAAREEEDGGTEANGGGRFGAAERFFDGVEGFDVELLETVSDGFSEEGALAGELGGEDRVFLEQR
jgi:hypothetical protein